MHSIILAVGAVGAIATSFVSYFLLGVIHKWRKTAWLKRHGVEANARIIYAEIINEEGRYLPFVRLKAEVVKNDGNGFTTTFDSLYSFSQLSGLMAGNTVRIKYNPADTTQVILTKHPAIVFKKEQQWPSAAKAPQLSLVS